MGQSILFAGLGIILGIISTLVVQRISRNLRYHDPGRKIKLEHLQKIQAWMESYEALFETTYPECPELILAHKMLSQKFPNYDKNSPVKLYDALVEYQKLQLIHDEHTQEALASLQALSDKRLDKLLGLNKALSAVFKKLKLLKGNFLFPVNFSADIDCHLKIIDQYRQKVFEEFPHKVIEEIEWEKLDSTNTQELYTIIHPCLSYYLGNEDIARDREKESRLFDEMQNLSFFRIVAKKEIEAILAKIHHQEEKYCGGD